jgi:Family of unknown function (DUF6069)
VSIMSTFTATTTVADTFPAAPLSGRAETSRRSVLKAGVLAAATGAIAASIVEAIGRAADVPMQAAMVSGSHAGPIGASGFAVVTVMSVALGVVLALVLRTRAANPARTFALVAGVLAAVSLLLPVTAAHTPTATKVVPTMAHVVVALVVIPLVARALPSRAELASDKQES